MSANLSFDDATPLQRIGKVQFDRLDDEYLGIDAGGGMCYSLNATAHQVWTLLEAPLAFGDLCRQLAAHYEVDESTVRADVPELLGDLRAANLIRIGS